MGKMTKCRTQMILAFMIVFMVAVTSGCSLRTSEGTVSDSSGTPSGGNLAQADSTQAGSVKDSAQAQNTQGGSSESVKTDSSADSYTFAWMSDTQYYCESYPDIYTTMTQWIRDNMGAKNIIYGFHTGDVVNNPEDGAQWKNANTSMTLLDDVLPYSVLAGNNDVVEKPLNYTAYLKNFGESRKRLGQDTTVYYKEGIVTAQTFEAGSLSFLSVAISWEADDEALAWANEQIQKYPERIVILSTHDYLESDGTRSKYGKVLNKALVKPNPNVRLVLCGHKTESQRKVSDEDDNGDGVEDDRVVYQLLSNYQNMEKGGNGYMKLLTVDEKKKTLSVVTYSPYLDDYNYYDNAPDKDTYTLDISQWFS